MAAAKKEKKPGIINNALALAAHLAVYAGVIYLMFFCTHPRLPFLPVIPRAFQLEAYWFNDMKAQLATGLDPNMSDIELVVGTLMCIGMLSMPILAIVVALYFLWRIAMDFKRDWLSWLSESH